MSFKLKAIPCITEIQYGEHWMLSSRQSVSKYLFNWIPTCSLSFSISSTGGFSSESSDQSLGLLSGWLLWERLPTTNSSEFIKVSSQTKTLLRTKPSFFKKAFQVQIYQNKTLTKETCTISSHNFKIILGPTLPDDDSNTSIYLYALIM